MEARLFVISILFILASLVYWQTRGYYRDVFEMLLPSIKRLALSFKYRFARQLLLPVKPIYLNFALTYKCNGRCLMCSNWKRYIKDPSKIKEELTLGDLKKFFLDNEDFLSDLKHIGLAGGEPFLRTDLVEVVKLVREKLPKVSIGLQTNGLLPEVIERELKQIVKFYPQITLAVSLDGIGETHDKIRGIKGAYQKVLKTIKVAQRIGVSEITAGMTVTKDNYSEIIKVRELLEKKGVELSFYPADEGEYYNTSPSTPSIALRTSSLRVNKSKSKSEIDALIRVLDKERGDFFYDNLRRQLLGESKRTLPCYSGWTSFVLDPYGELKPCVLQSDSFGNIKKKSLKEILSGEEAKKIRKKIKNCTCWNICEVSTSAVIDPWDTLRWFVSHADKKEFLKSFLKKKNRLG